MDGLVLPNVGRIGPRCDEKVVYVYIYFVLIHLYLHVDRMTNATSFDVYPNLISSSKMIWPKR